VAAPAGHEQAPDAVLALLPKCHGADWFVVPGQTSKVLVGLGTLGTCYLAGLDGESVIALSLVAMLAYHVLFGSEGQSKGRPKPCCLRIIDSTSRSAHAARRCWLISPASGRQAIILTNMGTVFAALFLGCAIAFKYFYVTRIIITTGVILGSLE
jgi:hypothetical protein